MLDSVPVLFEFKGDGNTSDVVANPPSSQCPTNRIFRMRFICKHCIVLLWQLTEYDSMQSIDKLIN